MQPSPASCGDSCSLASPASPGPLLAARTADVQQGTLLLLDGESKVAAPLLFTDVHIDVSGMTARARVTQRFVNPSPDWREGVYVFPLPEKAAVDHLSMQIGERVIEGQIKERQEAKRTYDAAKSEGKKATLVEQERPNLFTTTVAHIGPAEEIVVAIEYQQTLHYDAGSFALRFPLAITPRYIPGVPLAETDAQSTTATGFALPTDVVPDADRITPPVAHRDGGSINPVTITIDLAAGFPLARLTSPSHAIHVDERLANRYQVTLSDGMVPAARDFELSWTPDVGAAPGATLLTEERDGRKFALLMVLPPIVDATSVRAPREITYIVDTSGSMEGVSINQAKEALLMALDRLREGDRFNVIEFNSTTHSLYPAPMPADAATLTKARAFVRNLHARGGTEMLPALTAALSTPRAGSEMRQVVFLTDGAVGNENELLHLIEQRLDDRRLFTIGIGPAPNTYFLKKAAEAGRGTFTFIGDVREVKEKMSTLFRKIENPALTDMTVVWPTSAVTFPDKLPDLYAGEPVVLTAELSRGVSDGLVVLSGVRDGKAWAAKLPLDTGTNEPGIAVLWARDKIEALMDAKRNGAPADEIKRDVIGVALAHHLVSSYTSLVAVDVTPTAPAGVAEQRSALPTNLPDGLAYGAIFGVPQTATPAPLLTVAGALTLLLALGLYLTQHRGARKTREPLNHVDRIANAARRVC
ncbi:MAG TPA: marine proteobacterial sortase target protein, partial [Casimicrobiaceae bacterium]|nr:marine proteobacterial sortase target protein [Casimicrobiaceae bacterium]